VKKNLEQYHETLFLGFVVELNVDFNIATVESFNFGKQKIQYNPSLGLKQNDVIVICKVEGFFCILTKLQATNFEDKKIGIIDPYKLTELENRIKIKNKEEITKDARFPDYSYLKNKKEGDLVLKNAFSGFLIGEKIVNIFSGLNNIILNYKKALISSKEIFFKVLKNKSYIRFEENEEGTKSYKINFFKKKNGCLYVELTGDVVYGLQQNFIKINIDTLSISKTISLKIVAKPIVKKDNPKDKIPDKYSFASFKYCKDKQEIRIIKKEKSLDYIPKSIASYFNLNISKTLIKKFTFSLTIEKITKSTHKIDEYDILSFEAITEDGNKHEFFQKTFNTYEYKYEFTAKRIMKYSKDNYFYWGHVNYKETAPLVKRPIEYYKFYADKNDFNYLNKITFSYKNRFDKFWKWVSIGNIHDEKPSYRAIDSTIINNKATQYVIKSSKSFDYQPIILAEIANYSRLSLTNNYLLDVRTTSKTLNSYFYISDKFIDIKNIDTIHTNAKQFMAKETSSFFKSSLVYNYFYKYKNFFINDNIFYFKGKNFYSELDNYCYIHSNSNYFKANTQNISWIRGFDKDNKEVAVAIDRMSKQGILIYSANTIVM